MAKSYACIEPRHRTFIARQRVFFTASAAPGARVNVSPRSTTAFRVLGDNRVAYLDRTGSGNETAAHLLADGRLTIMFCAFEGPPLVLRLFGRGRALRRGGAEYAAMLEAEFGGEESLGARQIIAQEIDLVRTSCGFGVPLFEYVAERPTLDRWAAVKGQAGLEAYWREENMRSIDGLPTGLLDAAGAAT